MHSVRLDLIPNTIFVAVVVCVMNNWLAVTARGTSFITHLDCVIHKQLRQDFTFESNFMNFLASVKLFNLHYSTLICIAFFIHSSEYQMIVMRM